MGTFASKQALKTLILIIVSPECASRIVFKFFLTLNQKAKILTKSGTLHQITEHAQLQLMSTDNLYIHVHQFCSTKVFTVNSQSQATVSINLSAMINSDQCASGMSFQTEYYLCYFNLWILYIYLVFDQYFCTCLLMFLYMYQ